MSGFDYGNARLRAMKSRLLTKRELESLLETSHLEALIAALAKTVYQKPVEAALTRTTGIDCIDLALRSDLMNTVGSMGKFFQDRAKKQVNIVLGFYDVHNIKAVLRGLDNHVIPNEILMSTIPVGELMDNDLEEMARMQDPRGAIDLIGSMGLKFAQPLLQVRVRKPGARIADLELALNKWFYQNLFQDLQNLNGDGGVLKTALQMEADLTNMLTVLRFAHAPGERQVFRERQPHTSLEDLFVGPGNISFSTLEIAGKQDSVAAAIAVLENTSYNKPLKSGLEAYSRSTLLSDIERHLLRHRLVWRAGLIARDPLGIGVLLGYLALKLNEVRNLRWVTRGISLGLRAPEIREMLEYPL